MPARVAILGLSVGGGAACPDQEALGAPGFLADEPFLGAAASADLARGGGGARTTALPPAFSIFSTALFENLCAWTVSFLVSSPSPSTLSTSKRPRRMRLPLSEAALTSAPASKTSRSPTFTFTTTSASGLRKPRF